MSRPLVSISQRESRSKISLNALKTFEAVARHTSMSDASVELRVTPSAVSRQIYELQSVVSFDLFSGPRTNLSLTHKGQHLASTLTSALDEIDTTLSGLDETHDTVLDVVCRSTWACIKTWVIASLSGPDDLSNLPILSAKTRPQAWQEWQAQLVGSELIHPTQQNEFEHLSLAIEAAVNGLGVCVTPEHLVAGDTSSGRLIALLGFRKSGYVYVTHAHGRQKRRSTAFVDWLSHDLATS
ncbi:MAG: LysR family transcriptional regulator [Sulfitobacter sp.]